MIHGEKGCFAILLVVIVCSLIMLGGCATTCGDVRTEAQKMADSARKATEKAVEDARPQIVSALRQYEHKRHCNILI